MSPPAPDRLRLAALGALLAPAPLWAADGNAAYVEHVLLGLALLLGGLAAARLYHEHRQRKASEAQLAASQARRQAIIDTLADGVIVIDEFGEVLEFSPAAEAMFGYRAAEVVGENIRCLMPEPQRSAHDGHLARHRETGRRHVLEQRNEVEARRRDGSVFPVELVVTELHVDGRRLFSGLLRDITERRKVERMKDEFIATVSHELRTPLTAVRGSLGLIGGGAAGALPAQAATLVQLARDNCERLILLIDDLLDMERLGSGRMEFHFEQQALMPLVERAVADNRAFAERYSVQCHIVEQAPDVRVDADRERLLQLLANLLSNACKFSPPGETVQVAVGRHEQRVRIEIRDHGPGINEAFQPHLFDKFTQGDSSDSRQNGGTGLGLCISKAIVERHGGTIGFETGQGTGTTFLVELPLAQAAGRAAS